MSRPIVRPHARPRLTVSLRGTVSSIELKLDHASRLAIDYARHWIKRGPGALDLDVLASGVVRRALEVYMDHLSRPDLEPVQEARAAKACCSAIPVGEEAREAAQKRLHAHQSGSPMPPYLEVLHGHHQTRWADLEDRVDAIVQQMNRKKTHHMNANCGAPKP